MGALEAVTSVTNALQEVRDDADSIFGELYEKATTMCDMSRSRRRCERQVHRSNVPGGNQEDTYRAEIFIPLLDNTLHQLKIRFTDHNKKALSLGFLIPKIPINPESKTYMEECLDFYKSLLPFFTVEQVREQCNVWFSM